MGRMAGATVAVLCDVLGRWGVRPDGLHDITTGRANKHWRAVAGDTVYALRRYHARRPPDAIAWEHTLLAHVAARGWPVATPLPARDGGTAVEVGDACYALFPFLPGRPVPYGNRRYLRIKGRLLARLHATVASWPAPGQRDGQARLAEPEAALRAAGYASLDELLAPFARHDPDAARCLRSESDAVLDELAALAFDGLPGIPIHADFHTANLLFRRGALSGLLDFDSVRLDTRIADIATALNFDCREPPDYNPIDPDAVHAFLAGYREEAHLADGERATLLPLVRMHVLGMVGFRLQQWAETGAPRALRSIERTVSGRLPAFAAVRPRLEAAITGTSLLPRNADYSE